MALLHKTVKPIDDEQARLEKRVDAMMDSHHQPEPAAADLPSAPLLPHRSAKAAASASAPADSEAVATPAAPQTTPDELIDDVRVPQLKIDDAKSDAAIADIVAQESDEALAAEDASRSQADQAAAPRRRGHPIFWFIIVLLVCLIGLATLMLTNPNVKLPFSQ